MMYHVPKCPAPTPPRVSAWPNLASRAIISDWLDRTIQSVGGPGDPALLAVSRAPLGLMR